MQRKRRESALETAPLSLCVPASLRQKRPYQTASYNMHGRTARLVSQTPGWAGLLGTYGDQGFVELTGTRGAWEGLGNEVGFYPYRLDDGWCAFFGGNTVPEEVGDNQHFFGVGLARAASILGPWQRLAERNPVLLDPTFVENPVVDRLAPDLFVAVYDGATAGGIAYALSPDGIDWGAEQVMRWASAPAWLKAPRTPLGLLHEQGNAYTLYFTAFDGLYPDGFVEPWWHDGFGNVGLARVRLV